MAKKLRDEDLILNIIVNGDRGKKELGQLERTVKDARKELELLEKEEKKLSSQNKQNTARYKELTSAIKEKNKVIQESNQRMDQLRKGFDLNRMSINDLRKEIRRLQSLRNMADPMTMAWKKHDAELRKVQARYNELRYSAERTGNVITRLASGINKMFGAITAALATFTGVAIGVKKATDTFASFDDKISDVQKTTGLTKEEVLKLNDALKDASVIDSRTTQEGLLGLGRIAGKLGIEGRENLLGFIKAADEISVALTEDLGGDIEQSINTIGKLVDVFNVSEEFGIEAGMRKTGSLINELGANSAASEEEIVDFLSRLAGIGPSAGISISNIAGLGSTLSQLKQSMEVAGTTFVNIIPKMFTNTARFAEVAGMGVEEFSDLLNKDANEALIRFLEGLNGNNEGMEYMMQLLESLNLDGARAKNILSVMANNTDKLRKEQLLSNSAFQEGTSISEEFNIKNTNVAAQLDKSKKAVYNMWVELGERLYPVMISSNNLFATFLGIITTLVDFIKEYYREIAAVTVAMIAYNVALKANIILTQVKVFWEKAHRAAILLSAAAQAIYTSNLNKATKAMRLFTVVTRVNPFFLLLGAIAGVVTYLTLFNKKLTAAEKTQRELVDINKQANESIAEEKNRVQQLLRIARNREISDETRLKAVKELNEISPEYLGNLTLEKIYTNETTKAVEAYTDSLIRQAKMEAILNHLKEIESKRIEDELSKESSQLTFWQEVQSGFLMVMGFQRQAFELAVENSEKNNQDFLNDLNTRQKMLQGMYDDLLKESDKVKKEEVLPDRQKGTVGLTEEELKKQKELLEARKKFRKEVLESDRSLVEAENAAYEERLKNAGLFNKALEKMTVEDHQVQYILLKQHQANLDKIDADAVSAEISRREELHQVQLTELKIRQNEELRLVKDNDEARKKLQEQHQEEEEKLTREYAENLLIILQEVMDTSQWQGITSDDILSDDEKAALEKKILELREQLSELGLKPKDRPEVAEKTDIFGMTAEDWKLFGENIDATKSGLEGIIRLAGGLVDVWGSYTAMVKAGEDNELQRYEANVNQRKQLLEDQLNSGRISQESYNASLKKLDADLDKKKAEYAYKQAKRERDIALMSAIVNTASAVAEALPNIALSILAGAIGGFQIATIEKTPLPEVPGKEEGGYLDVVRSQDKRFFRARKDLDRRGYIDKPTVLAGDNGREFVASNDAYNNPTVRPVLDAIDTAQRNGTISTVNLEKILMDRPAYSYPGRQEGGFLTDQRAANTSDASPNTVNDSVNILLQETIRSNRELYRQLRAGIKANVSLLGKNGFYEAQNEYDQLTDDVNL